MKKFDPSSLKWGIADKNGTPIAAFDDQQAAQQFHQTLTSSTNRYANQTLQVVNIQTGEPLQSLESAGDRVS